MLSILEYFGGFILNGDEKTQYGQLGDYISGVWGTIISAITLILVYITWLSTRKSSRLQDTVTILSEMLKTHDSISEGGQFGFWDRRGTPSILLREFSAIYKKSKKLIPSYSIWSVEDRIDIAYTYAFYGLSTQARHSLSRYGDDNLKRLQDSISELRRRGGDRYRDLFKGHQATLSHYLRNLYGMYTLIDQSPLPSISKVALAKIVRTKLSNYDQALLALNIISHLGKPWETSGIVKKYKPFANIPQRFFGFDSNFDIKRRFPAVLFEWEQQNSRHSA